MRIKYQVDQKRDKIGIKIINKHHSYNKFATKPYEELAKIKKQENKFRKILGVKKDKRPVNNLDTGFKP